MPEGTFVNPFHIPKIFIKIAKYVKRLIIIGNTEKRDTIRLLFIFKYSSTTINRCRRESCTVCQFILKSWSIFEKLNWENLRMKLRRLEMVNFIPIFQEEKTRIPELKGTSFYSQN